MTYSLHNRTNNAASLLFSTARSFGHKVETPSFIETKYQPLRAPIRATAPMSEFIKVRLIESRGIKGATN